MTERETVASKELAIISALLRISVVAFFAFPSILLVAGYLGEAAGMATAALFIVVALVVTR